MSKNQYATSMEQNDFAEIQHEPLDLKDTEASRKVINKYQTKIKELLITQQKQKKTNQQLRQQLKNLNQTLNTLITKVSVSPKAKKDVQEIPRDDVTKKQLQNEMKKTAALRKQNESLKVRLKVYQAQRLGQLHDEIRQKNRIIQGMHQSLKLHQKMQKKEMNTDIYRKEEQAQLKIKSLSQELVHLKKKLQEQHKAQEIQEKSLKFQQHQLIQMQTKTARSPIKAINSQNPQQTYQLLQQENQRLKENLESSENTRKLLQKTHKTQIDLLKGRLKVSEKNVLDFKEQIDRKNKELSRKDKEISNLLLKLKNGQNNEQQNNKQQTAIAWSNPSSDCRRQLRGIKNFKIGARKFDDLDSFQNQNENRICSLTFRYFEEHIIQLITEYSSGKQKQKKMTFSLGTQYQSAKEVTLHLSDYQYIKQWEIYTSKLVQFIKIRTSKEQVLQIGNERNTLKCKKHIFEIKNYEKPISVFGVIEKRLIGDKQRQVLVALGLILKKKNVFASRSKSVSKLQSRPPQASSLARLNINDKNISKP